MGVLRLLLALTVVLSHASLDGFFGVTLVGGQAAVQAFYIISGFYMALILNEKYVGLANYRLFLSNRMLRLYPTYWVVCAITLAICFLSNLAFKQPFLLAQWFSDGAKLKLWSQILLVLSNLTIFGQDATLFMKQTGTGALAFTSNWAAHPPPVWAYLMIPQAWSLSLELTFYLIAPFIVTRKYLVVSLLLASVALRVLLVSSGLNHDPWLARFFPTELALFLLGSLSYHGYAKFQKSKGAFSRSRPPLLAIALLVVTCTFNYLPLPQIPKLIGYYLLVAAALPSTFRWTRDSKVDTYIGELSYPVYICHYTINVVLRCFLHTDVLAITSCFLSIVCAAVLSEAIVKPIDQFRQKRAGRLNQARTSLPKSEAVTVG